MSNQPTDTLRDGAIKATIWARNGEKGTFYSVEISRTYKDGETFKDSHSYSGSELLRVSRLAEQAYDRVRELKSEQQQEAG